MVTNDPQAAIAGLRKSLSDLINEARAVREDVQEDQRQRREVSAALRRSVKVALVAVAFCVILLAAVLVMVIQNNRTAAAAEEAARESRETSELIADCTIAGGKCADESRKRLAGAIDQLDQRNIRSDIAIIQCSRQLPIADNPAGPAFDAAFAKCVTDRLAKLPATK